METKHTPTPWRNGVAEDSTLKNVYRFYGGTGKYDIIAKCDSEQDAELIVRAVNNHAALLEALKNSHDAILGLYRSVNDKNVVSEEYLQRIRSSMKDTLEAISKAES